MWVDDEVCRGIGDQLPQADPPTLSSDGTHLDKSRTIWWSHLLECKSGNDKPWGLLSSDGNETQSLALSELLTEGRPANKSGGSLMADYGAENNLESDVPAIGYGLIEVFRDDSFNTPGEAMNQALHASVAEVEKAEDVFHWNSRAGSDSAVAVVAHPTVVIERPLLSVTLSDSGEFGVQEIPWGTVVNRAEKFGMWGQSVDVVSFDGLEEYLQHQDELKVNLMKYAIGRMF